MRPLKPQKYIYKLNSTYLDLNDYNVSIDTMDCVISIGHSQLIKWIEDLTGDHTSQFEPHLVSVQFDKKQHFDCCCRSLIINGKSFHRLYGTPGGLKMSTVLFIDNDIYANIYAKLQNGRHHTNSAGQDLKYCPSKLEAYYALTSSTSNKVSWPKMIVVKGTTVKFNADVIDVYTDENGGDPIVGGVVNTAIENEINDGCGIMTPEYSRQITNEAVGLDEISSGVCVRSAFLKGMLFTFPFKEFAANVAHKTTITDAWGHEQNIMDADVILTTSQLKLWEAYNSCEEYCANCRQNDYEFRLTKVSEPLDEYRNINYQFSQSYDLTDEQIDELISPTIDEIQDIMHMDYRKSIVYLAGCGLNDKNVMRSDNVPKALMINPALINDPYIYNHIKHMIQKKIRLSKISNIDVEGNFALISGDPYAMCEDIFGMPVRGLLGTGEIYHKFWQDKNVSEVVCMRAPMCAHYNIVKQKIKYSETADYWYRYIKDCIVLNSWDTLRIAESGCDEDGDILFTTNNRILTSCHRCLPALSCHQSGSVKMLSIDITEQDIAVTNKRSFKSKVGSITNDGSAMINLQANFPKNSKEWNELEKRIICIQHFQQLSIDSVKNGFKMTPMNPVWNTIQACANQDYYKSICAYRKPFFFIYRYNTTKSKYDQYNRNVDTKLKQRYGISLDTLLSSDDLPEELRKEKMWYYNKCPVDMSPGTINRIAWAVNKKFEDFNMAAIGEFDYSVLKSEVEYDMQTYSKVRQVYYDYKYALSNFMKKMQTDEINEDNADKSVFNYIYRAKFAEVCPNEEMLCNILIDLLYNKPNSKAVVWEICGDVIIKNLLRAANNVINYPEAVTEGAEFKCCRKSFRMKQLVVGGKEDGKI